MKQPMLQTAPHATTTVGQYPVGILHSDGESAGVAEFLETSGVSHPDHYPGLHLLPYPGNTEEEGWLDLLEILGNRFDGLGKIDCCLNLQSDELRVELLGDVAQWQIGEDLAGFGLIPGDCLDNVVHDPHQIAMRDHGTFRRTGGPRCVDNRTNRLWVYRVDGVVDQVRLRLQTGLPHLQ